MEQYITMSQKEISKYDILKKLIQKELNGTEAAKLLRLSVRHVRRLKKKVRNNGIRGLIHGNRGKEGNRHIPEKEKQKIIHLLHAHYYDFGPLLASEKLEERHNIARDKGTIRTIMIEQGLWKLKRKKKEQHREWRQRKASYGEMAQYDGCYAPWFGVNRGEYCLLASIDDANSHVWAQFDEHEGVLPTFHFWNGYIERFGKPYSIYVDRFSTYSMNHKLAQENTDTLTQFERAMNQDLGIEVIHAHSPEAKGRVEKLFKTLQDRLIKELRLQNISTVAQANAFLEKEFLPKFNTKFMVEARSKANLHTKLNEHEKNKLNSIFSKQEKRVVRNDFTIWHKKNYYQLLKEQPATICKQDTVIVEERMDGALYLRLRGKYLNYKILPERPKKISKDQPWVLAKTAIYKPAHDHPWRKMAKIEYFKKRNKNLEIGHF